MELDLDALERIAQAQEAAYARMLDIGEWVGGLGVHHPDMFRDLLAWDDSSANEHADTVLALIARVRELEAIVNDGGNQAAKHWTRLINRYWELADRYREAMKEVRTELLIGGRDLDEYASILTRALNERESEK